MPTLHTDGRVITFPDGTTARWSDLEPMYRKCGRHNVYHSSEALLEGLPPRESKALMAWAQSQEPLIDNAGVLDEYDFVFVLLLLHAARDQQGPRVLDVVDKILGKSPPTAIGVLLPAPT